MAAKKQRDFYLPVWETSDGSRICIEDYNAPTEAEARRKTEEMKSEVEAESELRFTGEIHKVDSGIYHLVRFGDNPKAIAFVLSGPMLDEIMALPHHPNVNDGVEQPLRRQGYGSQETGSN